MGVAPSAGEKKELRTALGDEEDKVAALVASKRRLQRGVEESTEHVATLEREVVELRNKLRRHHVEISASHNDAGDGGDSDDDTEAYFGGAQERGAGAGGRAM